MLGVVAPHSADGLRAVSADMVRASSLGASRRASFTKSAYKSRADLQRLGRWNQPSPRATPYESAMWSEWLAPTAKAARPPIGKVMRGSVWPKSTLASTGRPTRRS